MTPVQRRLFNMAIAIRDILERHNIPYIITYGTLLGAVRHSGFIPWDDDFDFYLFAESYDNAISILREELPQNMFLEDENSEPLYFHGWAHVKDLNTIVACKTFIADGIYAHKGLSVDLYKMTPIKRNELNDYKREQHIQYLHRKLKLGLISQVEFDAKCISLNNKPLTQKVIKTSNSSDIIYAFMSLDGEYLELDEIYPLKRYMFEGTTFYGQNQYHEFLQRCYGEYMTFPPEDKRIPHYSEVTFLD